MRAIIGSTYTPQYVLSIAKEISEKNLSELSDGQIQQLIQMQAMEDQNLREIQTGRKWRDYQKKIGTKEFMYRATKKTTRSMLLWRLLQQAGNAKYRPTQDLSQLGATQAKSMDGAIRALYGFTLRSDRIASISPLRDLIPIRDHHVPAEMIVLDIRMSSKGALVMEGATLRRTIGRSTFDSDIILAWGRFFGLLNVYDPSLVGLKGPKQMYPSAHVASLAELEASLSKTESAHDDASHLFRMLNLNRSSDISKVIVSRVTRNGDVWLLSEDEKSVGNVVSVEGLDPAKVAIMARREPSSEDFERSLKESYRWLLRRAGSPYVWITAVRSLVCRTLLISNQVFDNSLRSLYDSNPDSVELLTTASSLSRKLRGFEQAFNLYGQKYRMIRLG